MQHVRKSLLGDVMLVSCAVSSDGLLRKVGHHCPGWERADEGGPAGRGAARLPDQLLCLRLLQGAEPVHEGQEATALWKHCKGMTAW